MQSFTFGSDEGMQALVEKQDADYIAAIQFPESQNPWCLIPNPSDFKTLVQSLLFTANNAAEKGDLALCEATADLLGSIAESLGVEFI